MSTSLSIAMLGLGRMGANMAKRMAFGGIQVEGFDASADARTALNSVSNIRCHDSLQNLSSAGHTSIYWVMLPAGEITEQTLLTLSKTLTKGALVIDGGNTNY